MRTWSYAPKEKILQWCGSSSSSTRNQLKGSFFPCGLCIFLGVTATVLLTHAAATGYVHRVNHTLAHLLFPLAYTIAAVITVKIKNWATTNKEVKTESTGSSSQGNQQRRSVIRGILLVLAIGASASLMFAGGNLYIGLISPMLLVVLMFVSLGSMAYLTDNEAPVAVFVITCWIHACIFPGIAREDNLPFLIAPRTFLFRFGSTSLLVAAVCFCFRILWNKRKGLLRAAGMTRQWLKSAVFVFMSVLLVLLSIVLMFVPEPPALMPEAFFLYSGIHLMAIYELETRINKADRPTPQAISKEHKGKRAVLAFTDAVENKLAWPSRNDSSSSCSSVETSEEIIMKRIIGTLPEEAEERQISYEDLGESTSIELENEGYMMMEYLFYSMTEDSGNNSSSTFVVASQRNLHSIDTSTVAGKTDVEKSIEVDPDKEEPLDVVVEKEGYMRECLLYCSLFPANYEFTRDILIWSWIAAGLIHSEAEAIRFFDRLIRSNYILQSGYDHTVDQMKYKVENGNLFHKILPSQIPYRKVVDIGNGGVEVQHLSLIFEQIYQIESIRKCTQLKTLLLHKCWGFEFQKVLHNLFLELKLLTKLDLSGTNIEELPYSIEKLTALRYLDVSDTPIRWLPESLDSLGCLETLILLRCLSLYGLPRCMYKLVKLQHLLVDVSQLLQSMPIQIGKLTNLQTLGAFVIGTKDGSGIGELRSMNKLRGSLCLMNLENILNVDEAREARLWDKQYLSKLEFRWGDLEDSKITIEEEILECLRPTYGLQELKIVSYSGGVFPSWIGDPSFDQIDSIGLYGCRYCEKLPSLGALPSLKSLKIVDMAELVRIDELFCQNQANPDQKSFPKLERLSLEQMSNLETWTGVEDGHFPCLKELLIKYCQKLGALPSLLSLKSLQHLEICYCPKLSCLPERGLPNSLQSLMLSGCPILKDRCCNEKGADWAKVAGVPALYIDHQKIGANAD